MRDDDSSQVITERFEQAWDEIHAERAAKAKADAAVSALADDGYTALSDALSDASASEAAAASAGAAREGAAAEAETEAEEDDSEEEVEEADAKVAKRVAAGLSQGGFASREDAELIAAMLRLEPGRRPTAEEVLGSEMLRGRAAVIAECVVCLDSSPTHAMLPCGHRCLCAGCLVAAARECSMCRAPSHGTVRIFE